MARLRVVGLPGPDSRYLLVLDQYSLAEQDTMDPCAGTLVFADQVEVE